MRSVCFARRQKGFENLLNQMYTVPLLLFSLFNVFSIAVYIKKNTINQ